MPIRKDVIVSKISNSTKKPWAVRWWGKYDPMAEKQPRFSKSFPTRKIAEKYAQTLKEDIEDGISVETKKISLGILCQKVMTAKKGTVRPSSLTTYQVTVTRLLNYFGSDRIAKTITKEEAEGFVAGITLMEDGSAPSDTTRDRNYRNARLLFNKALDWGYIRHNPFKGISLGKAQKEEWYCITPAEFNRIMHTIDTTPIHKYKINSIRKKRYRYIRVMLKAFFTIMYDCGLRFGEAINLLWEDGNLDFANASIYIKNRTSSNGLPPFLIKDHESRSIPCTKRVMQRLNELREVYGQESPYVFLSSERYKALLETWNRMKEQGKQDKWVNAMMINNTVRKFKLYCQKAGIITSARLCIHCLRKGYGTNLANLGTPVHTLKELMGHSRIETTMEYYVKSTDANKRQAVAGLDRLAEEW